MPAKPQWLLRLPDILIELSILGTPIVDRATIERLFGLKRRRAIQLMHQFAPCQAGRTLFLDRLDLIRRLRQLAAGPEFTYENRRKQRLVEALEKVRKLRAAAQVAIPVSTDALQRKMKDLPPGIILRPGHLEVQFHTAEELLAKLFELAQAVANDFEAFRSATEPI
jgi:hypothetical protein